MELSIDTNNRALVNTQEQTSFIETTLGKTINAGLDIGIRALLPDLIEDQIIDIKDTIIKEGFGEGVKKAIDSAIDLGKSAIGLLTGNFENVTQVQNAVKNGGIIDGISSTIDFVLNKINNKTSIPYAITNTIKKGKNVLLNSISNNIESEFTNQLDNIEKLQKYSNNWKEYYNAKDFEGMEKEYNKMTQKLKELIPFENTLKEARQIENIHTLIKNNNKNFNLSKEQQELVQLLT